MAIEYFITNYYLYGLSGLGLGLWGFNLRFKVWDLGNTFWV
jgi:hypothetical protein